MSSLFIKWEIVEYGGGVTPIPPFQEGTSNPSFRYNSRQTDFDRKIVKKYLSLKTLPEPRNVPEERANMTLTNSIFLKSSKKVPVLLLASFVKSKKWVLMEMTIVKDFVREVRPEQGIPAVLRYETKPCI